jgi:prophage regulatory protein
MGAVEIRQRLGGISRQRVYQLTQRRDRPVPYDELVQGKVWWREDVEAWIDKHRPGLEEADEWPVWTVGRATSVTWLTCCNATTSVFGRGFGGYRC